MSQLPPGPPPASPSYANSTPPKTNGLAVASLVCGLVACVPFVTGIAAVLLGIFGVKRANDPQVNGGKGLAIAGIILGVLGIIGWAFGSLLIAGGGMFIAKATAPGREAAKNWMTAVSAGDIDKAASLSVDTFPREDIEKIADHMKQFGAFQDMTSSNINLVNSQLTLAGVATFAGGTTNYNIVVIDTGSGWKLMSIQIE